MVVIIITYVYIHSTYCPSVCPLCFEFREIMWIAGYSKCRICSLYEGRLGLTFGLPQLRFFCFSQDCSHEYGTIA
jgi:hypothetical protein